MEYSSPIIFLYKLVYLIIDSITLTFVLHVLIYPLVVLDICRNNLSSSYYVNFHKEHSSITVVYMNLFNTEKKSGTCFSTNRSLA